jgi:pimeloyl-ACP methyl ester carboxylesterase
VQFVERDGVRLAYSDGEADLSPMLLVHGCGLDHRSFSAQAEFFRKSYRVISVDLRGHGASEAPHQDYTMTVFEDDLAWLCAELGLRKPIIVGHSMGGSVRSRAIGPDLAG